MYLWLSDNYTIILRVSAKADCYFHLCIKPEEKTTTEIFPSSQQTNLSTNAEFTCSKLIGMLEMGANTSWTSFFSPENIQEMSGVGLKVGERGILFS